MVTFLKQLLEFFCIESGLFELRLIYLNLSASLSSFSLCDASRLCRCAVSRSQVAKSFKGLNERRNGENPNKHSLSHGLGGDETIPLAKKKKDNMARIIPLTHSPFKNGLNSMKTSLNWVQWKLQLSSHFISSIAKKTISYPFHSSFLPFSC